MYVPAGMRLKQMSAAGEIVFGVRDHSRGQPLIYSGDSFFQAANLLPSSWRSVCWPILQSDQWLTDARSGRARMWMLSASVTILPAHIPHVADYRRLRIKKWLSYYTPSTDVTSIPHVSVSYIWATSVCFSYFVHSKIAISEDSMRRGGSNLMV